MLVVLPEGCLAMMDCGERLWGLCWDCSIHQSRGSVVPKCQGRELCVLGLEIPCGNHLRVVEIPEWFDVEGILKLILFHPVP